MLEFCYVMLLITFIGVVINLTQRFLVWRYVKNKPELVLEEQPPISILKPLAGIDEDLWDNLENFATGIDYDNYEIVLGVKNMKDPAWPVAQKALETWPERFRLVIQRGEPGLNPKVNQLITLEKNAEHDILVISDSNVKVDPHYLKEIAFHLQDENVGLVTHPVTGWGMESLGSDIENLHMTIGIANGMIAAKEISEKIFAVGKSMAMHRKDVEALGGFEAYVNVLAEDFCIGRAIGDKLNKEVVMAHNPIWNVTRNRSIGDFIQRFKRWSVMQRKAVGSLTQFSQVLMNISLLSFIAMAVYPVWWSAAVFFGIVVFKSFVDLGAMRQFNPKAPALRTMLQSPLKDLLWAYTWAYGMVSNHVNWRGNILRIGEGTALSLPKGMEHPSESKQTDAA